jgi:hypothetical protein
MHNSHPLHFRLVIRLLCLHLLRLQLRLRFPPALGDLVEDDLEALGEAALVEAALGDLGEAALGEAALGEAALGEAAFESRSTIFIKSQLYLKLSLK